MVFEAIYTGKKAVKSVEDIANATGFTDKQVVTAGKDLLDHGIVEPAKARSSKGRLITAYKKVPVYSANKRKILNLVRNEDAKEKYRSTKTKTGGVNTVININTTRMAINKPDIQLITRIDIPALNAAAPSHINPNIEPSIIPEEVIKKGFQALIKAEGVFKDSGGELYDLFGETIVCGRIRRLAIAFKGKSKQGLLTPEKMGTRADQIQRLFRSPAQAFLVVYHSQIAHTVIEQMQNFAIGKNYFTGERIYYGVIDGKELKEIIAANPDYFVNK